MIHIDINFTDPNTAEYAAAQQIKRLFQEQMAVHEHGRVLICPNVYLLGQKVRQLDLVVIGQFERGVSRSKLEKITKAAILKDQLYAQAIGEKLVVIRGRAGTGKTVKLLHIAHDLCVNQQKRCLILTYNKALVSDIRRLIALAGIGDDITEPTMDVRTDRKSVV